MSDAPSYAGAKQAIEAYLRAAWNEDADGDIAVANGGDVRTQLDDEHGTTIPWLHLMIDDAGSAQTSFGVPGARQFVYDGIIRVVVFVPVGSGTEQGDKLASKVEDIFRCKQFYDSVPGFAVRSWSPHSGYNDKSDDGLWFSIIVSCPFEYLHRA